MRRWLVALCVVLALVALAFWVGRAVGVDAESKRQTKRDLQLHRDLVDLDRRFLTNVLTRPGAMASGRYSLEVRLAGKTETDSQVELEFSNGQLTRVSGLPIQNIVQTGNVVSWERYDIDEGPSATFVGTIDGNEMWGRVYIGPGQGWHQGEPPMYGVWRAIPESEKR